MINLSQESLTQLEETLLELHRQLSEELTRNRIYQELKAVEFLMKTYQIEIPNYVKS